MHISQGGTNLANDLVIDISLMSTFRQKLLKSATVDPLHLNAIAQFRIPEKGIILAYVPVAQGIPDFEFLQKKSLIQRIFPIYLLEAFKYAKTTSSVEPPKLAITRL
jgi:hypothetical protein